MPSGGEPSRQRCAYGYALSSESMQDVHDRLQPLCTKCVAPRDPPTQSKGKRKIPEETASIKSEPPDADVTAHERSNGRTRTRLTKGEKLDVIKLRETKTQVAEIARRFSCGERTVYNIIKNRSALEEEAKSPEYNDARKSARPSLYPKVEQGVAELVDQARRHRLPVTMGTITSFAETTKDRLLSRSDLSSEERRRIGSFCGSHKWIKNFLERHRLSDVIVRGEGGSIDDNLVKDGVELVKIASRDYRLRNIFNVDETELFFRLLPRRTYLVPSEGRKTVRGAKDMAAKDRVTMYLCANATGSAKVPVSIIGRSENPPSFEGQRSPIRYFSQSNAWSDEKTFRTWFNEVFLPFARQHTRGTEEKVLLLMDFSGSHDVLSDPEGLVRVVMYPPNSASKYQPMSTGIIAATKTHYRRRLLRRRTEVLPVVERLRAASKEKKARPDTQGLLEGHQLHMLDAAELIKLAWNDVSGATIARSWVRAATLPRHYQTVLNGFFTQTAPPEQGETSAIAELSSAVRDLGRTIVSMEDVETDANSSVELLGVLRELGMKPGDSPDQAAVDAIADWAVIEDRNDIAEALRVDVQRIIEKETEACAGGRNESDEEKDGAVAAADESDGDGEAQRWAPTCEEVLQYLDMIEEFVVKSDHHDFLRHLRRYRRSLCTPCTAQATSQS